MIVFRVTETKKEKKKKTFLNVKSFGTLYIQPYKYQLQFMM